jgi:hypothetical protein
VHPPTPIHVERVRLHVVLVVGQVVSNVNQPLVRAEEREERVVVRPRLRLVEDEEEQL